LHPNDTLTSSVSALEDFAECPFRHFASRQLRLAERQELKVDPAGTGTLLHAVLKQFHEETLSHGGRWRDWPPDAARQRILELGDALLTTPDFAAHRQDPLVTWESQGRLRRLAQTVGQLVAWMESCSFDPILAEFEFGPHTDVASWTLDLPANRTLHLRGSIDRIDFCELPDGRRLIAVIDYKSSARSLTPAGLAAGVELQLLGYLAFAVASPDLHRALPNPNPHSSSPTPPPPEPAGAFYIPLSPGIPSADRDTPDPAWHRKSLDALVHSGRGNRQWLVAFDPALAQNPKQPDHSRQFKPRQFLEPDAFQQLLNTTTHHLRQHATRILDGQIGVQPLRFSPQKTACDHCPFRPVCRFEPRLGGFRSLLLAHGHPHPTTTTGH
jgi:ATP-dependent helicase/nuclease subunit B